MSDGDSIGHNVGQTCHHTTSSEPPQPSSTSTHRKYYLCPRKKGHLGVGQPTTRTTQNCLFQSITYNFVLILKSNIGVLILVLDKFFFDSNNEFNYLSLFSCTTLSKCFRNQIISKTDLKLSFKSLFRLSLNCALLIPNV
jgi:hypothetical protein